MKFRTLLFFFLFARTSTFAQNIIHTDSFPQPTEITEKYQRSDINISSIWAFHTEPDVLILENEKGTLQMAVNDEFNFSYGQDDWRIWDLDFDTWGWTCNISDTVQLNNTGNPEIVVEWSYDEPFGAGWRGGHHIFKTQIWDIDAAKLLLEIINYDDYVEYVKDSVEIKFAVAEYYCGQDFSISNNAIDIGPLKGDKCELAEEDLGLPQEELEYGIVNALKPGRYFLKGSTWVQY